MTYSNDNSKYLWDAPYRSPEDKLHCQYDSSLGLKSLLVAVNKHNLIVFEWRESTAT